MYWFRRQLIERESHTNQKNGQKINNRHGLLKALNSESFPKECLHCYNYK